MKLKFLALLLTLIMALSLVSCTNQEAKKTDAPVAQDEVEISENNSPTTDEPDVSNQPDEKPQTNPETDEKPSTEPSSTDTPSQSEPKDEPIQPTSEPSFEIASTFIDKSASSLVAAIGQPSGGKTYVTSCIGEGDDGEWYYPDFTVYTYRAPSGNEKIIDVLKN